MKTITGICHALVAMFAFVGAETAQAEWYGFKGSATSPSYWNDSANWYCGGTNELGDVASYDKIATTTCNNIHINANAAGENKPGFVSGWDKTVTFRKAGKLSSTLKICAGTATSPIIFAATYATNGLDSARDLWVKDDTNNGYGSTCQTPAPCLEIQSGTYKFTYFRLGNQPGKTSTLVVNGGTLKATGNYSRIGITGANGVFTVKAGSYDNLSSSNKNLTLGQDSGSSGTLNVQGGSCTVGGYIALNYNANAVKSVINITGGTLVANQLYLRHEGTDGGTITIDGGTLKAYSSGSKYTPVNKDHPCFLNADDNLHVYVGDAGATFDTSGFDITIAEDLENKSGEIGAARFTGGGTVTLTGELSYTGATIIDLGTTLAIPSRRWLDSQTFGGIVVGMHNLAANETRDILKTASGAFTAADLAKFSLMPAIPSDVARLELATTTSENDTIRIVAGGSNVIVVDNNLESLAVSGETELVGAGGVKLSSLAIPADATLVFDPNSTPIKVSATPTFAAGACLALTPEYASMTCGRVVLMTYSGTATIPSGLFDTSCVANPSGCVLTQETAPDGKSKQLVLTVGDYAHAPEIRILPIGDSITHGYVKNIPSSGVSQQAQYRTLIASRLAANGYKPVMLGHLCRDASNTEATCDAAGVRQPSNWIWHSGVSGDKIISDTSGTTLRAGVRDNLHVYLDVAGEPDVVTLLIGTNDIGGGKQAAEVFEAYTNLVWGLNRQRPRTKIVASTILARANDTANTKIKTFNANLLSALATSGALPDTYCCTNLYPVAPQSVADNYFDGTHPTMKGFDPIAKGFAAKIMEALPRATYLGPIDDKLNDAPQVAQGATNNVPAAYRAGMVHVFTIDAARSNNNFSVAAPYTKQIAGVSLSRRIKKAGYYMELVRKGTSRRRFVWVDFDASGKTLDEIDFPWTGANIDLVVEKLHVFSNDGSIHNVAPDDDSIKGVVEGTHFNYSAKDDNNQVPGDICPGIFGWNDTLGTSGTYACFQAHRIFSQQGCDTHWNNGEVLFAWNDWGSSARNDGIGIGTFYVSAAIKGSGFSTDYTHIATTTKGAAETLTAGAYQVRHLEIWVEVDKPLGSTIIIK